MARDDFGPACGAYIAANIFSIISVVFEAIAILAGIVSFFLKKKIILGLDSWFVVGLMGTFGASAVFWIIHLFLPTCYCWSDSGNYVWISDGSYLSAIPLGEIREEFSHPYCDYTVSWTYIVLFILELVTAAFGLLLIIKCKVPLRTLLFPLLIIATLAFAYFAFLAHFFRSGTDRVYRYDNPTHNPDDDKKLRQYSHEFDTSDQLTKSLEKTIDCVKEEFGSGDFGKLGKCGYGYIEVINPLNEDEDKKDINRIAWYTGGAFDHFEVLNYFISQFGLFIAVGCFALYFAGDKQTIIGGGEK